MIKSKAQACIQWIQEYYKDNPDEGMLEWAEKLLVEGFTAEEIRTMMVTNPRKLLGKEQKEERT